MQSCNLCVHTPSTFWNSLTSAGMNECGLVSHRIWWSGLVHMAVWRRGTFRLPPFNVLDHHNRSKTWRSFVNDAQVKLKRQMIESYARCRCGLSMLPTPHQVSSFFKKLDASSAILNYWAVWTQTWQSVIFFISSDGLYFSDCHCLYTVKQSYFTWQ